jgi:CelD/BcsL family acetyltransferase involved in cellulose biosynthesis
MNSVSARLSCAVLTDFSSVAQIEREWDALYHAAEDPFLADSFDWARLSWERICRPRDRELICVVVRAYSGAAAILPLVVSRRGLWRVATPLSSAGSEYCPFLIDPRVSEAEVMAAIWRKIEEIPRLDALYLPNVREDRALGRSLAARRDAARTHTLPTARIRFNGWADWESFFATRSSRMRQELRRKLRGAERLGTLRFCEITDPAERQEVWGWLVRHKKAALARRGINDWLLCPRHVGFVAATLDALGDRRPLLALKLDGAVIAAGLCSRSPTQMEGFVMAYDESHGRISPGALLQMFCARWALEHGLDLDMRTGHEAFKSQWANELGEVSTYAAPLSAWGRLYVAAARARRWLGLHTPQSLRARVRRWLEGVAGPGAGPEAQGAEA